MQYNCSVEYSSNAIVDAFCVYEGEKRKIVICEGTVLSVYRYSSILSCLYNVVKLKDDKKDIQRHSFIIHSTTSNGEIIDTSIIISDSLKENMLTDYIAMIALKCIISHEIGHLLSGHIEYRKNAGENSVAFSMAETISKIDNTTYPSNNPHPNGK